MGKIYEVGSMVKVNFRGEVKEGVITSIEKIYCEWNENDGFIQDGFKILEGSLSNIPEGYILEDDCLIIKQENSEYKYKHKSDFYSISINGYMIGVPETLILSIIKTKEENFKKLKLDILIQSINSDVCYEPNFSGKNKIEISDIEISCISEIKSKVKEMLSVNSFDYNDFTVTNGLLISKSTPKSTVYLKINDVSLDMLLGNTQMNSQLAEYIFDDLEVKNVFKDNVFMQYRDVFKISQNKINC